MSAQDPANSFRDKFAASILSETDFRGEKTFLIKVEALHDAARYLKDEQGFDYLIDISSLDHFGDSPRFEVVYELCNLGKGSHIRLKAALASDEEPVAPTVVDLWPTADWHEREVYDMMGIKFDGHPNLTRILMWEGYPYHPLRKDFPLQGKPSETEEVAFTHVAPLAGGPFVTVPTSGNTQVREPRARRAGDEPVHEKFIAEP
ncbi:MAG: NADH dehydrogenase [Verrucomicrobia bacterium 61-8]|nr:NADH-quinone oxidoreductase subunit C [Verrucomicrobiota bacterium]OJU98932.1 MAG: NADH dehydrogenase [Verrucomicrobia bacterium 61-8]